MPLPERIAHLVVHRRGLLWSVFAVLIVASVALIAGYAKLNSDVLDMLPAEFESVGIYKLADREFSAARDLMFGLFAPEDKADEVDMDGFCEHFATELRKEPWVTRVMEQSPIAAPGGLEELRAVAMPLILNQNPADFAKTVAALQPDAIRARLDQLRAKLDTGVGLPQAELEHDPLGIVFPALKGLSTSKPISTEDPSFRLVMVHSNQEDLNEKACNLIMEQVEAFKQKVVASWPADRGPAPRILCTGRTAYVAEMAGKLKMDIQSTMAGSMLLVAVTFYAGFRRWRPLRAIVDALLFTCVLAVACGAALFGSLNMITIGLCSILVGLGVDLAMVLYAFYLDERNRGHEHEQAIAAALRTHGAGIWFGAMTTAAAFLCLLGSGSPGYRQLGVLIACGILIAALVMMTFLWLFLDIKLPRWLYHAFVGAFIIAGLIGVYVIVTSIGTWSSYAWQNIAAGVISTVIAVFMVDGLGRLTSKLPNILFSRPWRLLGVSLPLLILVALCAVLPIGRVVFDIDPKTLEPKPSNAGDALRLIMDKLNPGGMDSVMAVIQAPDQEAFSDSWQKADHAWRQRLEGETAPGVVPLFKSITTPAGLATSPSRMQTNATELAKMDFAKTKSAFTDALTANQFDLAQFAGAQGLLNALGEAASGQLKALAWTTNLPETSSWWFVIDNLISRDKPLGIARLMPSHPIKTPQDAAALREAMQIPGVQLGLSGWAFTLSELKPWSESKMVTLSAMMVGLNTIILFILLRHWKPVLIIMVGMAFSTAGLFATLKATGVTLNLFNVLAFPLVLGVGVDYSIYATLAIRSHDPRRELRALMKPLLLSGLTTVIGFITLAWSYNPALRGLGLLCGIGVGWCLFTAFVYVLPACAIFLRQDNAPAAPLEPSLTDAETAPAQIR